MMDVVTEEGNDPVTWSLEQLAQAASGFSTGPWMQNWAMLARPCKMHRKKRKKYVLDTWSLFTDLLFFDLMTWEKC